MSDAQQITLDSPIYSNRLRPTRGATYFRRSVNGEPVYLVGDIVVRQPRQRPVRKITPDRFYARQPLQDLPAPLPQAATIPKVEKSSQFTDRFNKLFMGMALLIFGFGLAIGFYTIQTNKHIKAQVQGIGNNTIATDNEENNEAPSEDKPTGSLSNYVVAPDLPRFIRIPKINVETRVKRLGAKSNGEVMAPSNIFDTGWYDGSSKLGESGATFIAGHVHGLTQPAIFSDLKKLVPGDTIEVERGDGKKFNYEVIKTRAYDSDNVDMAALLNTIEPGKSGLNLMTCTGKVIGTEYQQRLAVFAILMD